MSDAEKEDAKRRALHEAAHAVVGMALGLKLVRVTINGGGVTDFEEPPQRARDQSAAIAMLWASSLAEERYAVDPAITAHSASIDMAMLEEIARSATDA